MGLSWQEWCVHRYVQSTSIKWTKLSCLHTTNCTLYRHLLHHYFSTDTVRAGFDNSYPCLVTGSSSQHVDSVPLTTWPVVHVPVHACTHSGSQFVDIQNVNGWRVACDLYLPRKWRGCRGRACSRAAQRGGSSSRVQSTRGLGMLRRESVSWSDGSSNESLRGNELVDRQERRRRSQAQEGRLSKRQSLPSTGVDCEDVFDGDDCGAKWRHAGISMVELSLCAEHWTRVHILCGKPCSLEGVLSKNWKWKIWSPSWSCRKR